MTVLRADAETEAGTPPTAELMAKMGELMEEITRAGVLLATEGLKPSAQGARVSLSGGKLTVTDGPFAETKELIASYGLIQVKSKEEAVHWTRRFLEVLGEGTCDLYQVFEESDFGEDIFPPEEAAKERAIREEMKANAARQ
jgi:hypothetical protein